LILTWKKLLNRKGRNGTRRNSKAWMICAAHLMEKISQIIKSLFYLAILRVLCGEMSSLSLTCNRQERAPGQAQRKQEAARRHGNNGKPQHHFTPLAPGLDRIEAGRTSMVASWPGSKPCRTPRAKASASSAEELGGKLFHDLTILP
jgi:hypothetical protein